MLAGITLVLLWILRSFLEYSLYCRLPDFGLFRRVGDDGANFLRLAGNW